MRPIFFLLLLFFGSAHALAQFDYNLTGGWAGVLLQNEDGYAPRFELFLNLEHNGIFLKGKAFVKLGKLQAEMSISGYQTTSGSWKLTEDRILRENKAGEKVSWCLKDYELIVNYHDGEVILSGPWWGSSEYGPCVPGSVKLRRSLKTAFLESFLRRQYAIDAKAHG